MKLLAFSRRQVLQTSPVDLNDVVSTLAPWLARLIGEHIQLRTELAPELGQVLGDSLQLEQVLMNLAVNAKDAMPHGGTLTISTANVELDGGFVASHRGARAGPHVCLRVQDTGHGIDADTMPRIFEPFYTTKPVGQGTGLGLAVVYGIAKQSSGYIDVESRPGEGAAFSLYLPRLTGTAMPEAVEEPDTEPGRGHESILVVEDEPAVRTLLANVLRHQGYAVREAGNGEEGLEAAGQSAPALLVTDLVMPRMGGFELARRLRDRYPGVKILYMTGYGDEDRIGSQQTDPKAPQLQKPFGPDVLARKVREILDDAIAAP
jgi:CheY-like chemotaxis protein